MFASSDFIIFQLCRILPLMLIQICQNFKWPGNRWALESTRRHRRRGDWTCFFLFFFSSTRSNFLFFFLRGDWTVLSFYSSVRADRKIVLLDESSMLKYGYRSRNYFAETTFANNRQGQSSGRKRVQVGDIVRCSHSIELLLHLPCLLPFERNGSSDWVRRSIQGFISF